MSLQRLLAVLRLSCQKVQCAPWELRDTLLDLLLCCWPLRLFHSDRFTIEAQALNHSAMAVLTPLHFTPWPGAEKTQQETNGCHNIIYHHCSLHLRTQSTPPPPLVQGWALCFSCIISKCSPQASIEHYIMKRPCKHKEMFCNMLLELTWSNAVVWKSYLKDKSKR